MIEVLGHCTVECTCCIQFCAAPMPFSNGFLKRYLRAFNLSNPFSAKNRTISSISTLNMWSIATSAVLMLLIQKFAPTLNYFLITGICLK